MVDTRGYIEAVVPTLRTASRADIRRLGCQVEELPEPDAHPGSVVEDEINGSIYQELVANKRKRPAGPWCDDYPGTVEGNLLERGPSHYHEQLHSQRLQATGERAEQAPAPTSGNTRISVFCSRVHFI